MKRGATQFETCRLNGWTVGTLLAGDEGYGETVIRITAIGEDVILARTVSHNGSPRDDAWEQMWRLGRRDWREVTATEETEVRREAAHP